MHTDMYKSFRPTQRPLRFFAWGVMLVISTTTAVIAKPEDCTAIANADRRALCFAIANDAPRTCEQIRDRDTRSMCLARLTSKPVHCSAIKDPGMKRECEGLTR